MDRKEIAKEFADRILSRFKDGIEKRKKSVALRMIYRSAISLIYLQKFILMTKL
ncbi:MAG: hypothetical protein U9Q68_11275 [Euryarchaeota archaeon]|nr:hypothetical protein [Euryarchaeota archaeon]